MQSFLLKPSLIPLVIAKSAIHFCRISFRHILQKNYHVSNKTIHFSYPNQDVSFICKDFHCKLDVDLSVLMMNDVSEMTCRC